MRTQHLRDSRYGPENQPAFGGLAQYFRFGSSCWAPAFCYRYLLAVADRLLKLSAIDPFERFEMAEIASAAFCHYIEATPEEWLCPAADYAAYDESSVRVGTLTGILVLMPVEAPERCSKPRAIQFVQTNLVAGLQFLDVRAVNHGGYLRKTPHLWGRGLRFQVAVFRPVRPYSVDETPVANSLLK